MFPTSGDERELVTLVRHVVRFLLFWKVCFSCGNSIEPRQKFLLKIISQMALPNEKIQVHFHLHICMYVQLFYMYSERNDAKTGVVYYLW